MPKDKPIFDVAVVGGGPSGMIAAGRAAELGAKVLLIEKNKKLGRKLLMTGQGRCNLTNATFDSKEFVKGFGRKGDFLLSALSVFDVKKTIDFFNEKGLKTKIERGGRVFPLTDNAHSVLGCLIKYLRDNKVSILSDTRVTSMRVVENNRIKNLFLDKRRKVKAKNYIICTGGKSYPITGSTGDAFRWAKKLGHSVVPLRPALTPLRTKEGWVKELQGLDLKNVEVSVVQAEEKKEEIFGDLIFTHFGLSGPIILKISKKVGQLLKVGEVKLIIDLKPALNFSELDKRVQKDFDKYSRKMFKNSLSDLLPSKIIPLVVKFSGIDERKKVNIITREERHRLIRVLKGIEINVRSLYGFRKAIVTSGGISLKEIESKTMRSKKIKNLFFAGEVIDLDGTTGGYNLQMCWTTGFVAGQNSALT